MNKCSKCRVSIIGDRRYCPLCQNVLENFGNPTQETFPKPENIYHRFAFLFKILKLSSVIACVISIFLNLMIPESGIWAHFVAAGIICGWISFLVVVKKRENIPKTLLYQVFIISLLAMIWDFATGWNNWSIDFVVPISSFMAIIVMSIICTIKKIKISDYIFYFFIDAVFGIIPIIFFLTGILMVIYPSLICVALSIISIASLIVFEGKNMAKELKRRFHF